MLPLLLPLALPLLFSVAKADFLISNTTICMGAFPMNSCWNGPQVLTPGTPNNASSNSPEFKCDVLVPAQDEHFVQPGRMGLTADLNLHVDGGICGSGRLNFEKNGEEYIVKDGRNETVGNCVALLKDEGGNWAGGNRSCPQLLGNLFFLGAWECASSVCS